MDNFRVVERGRFREKDVYALLTGGRFPARNPLQNVNDLKAQIAANEKGAAELRKMVRHFGVCRWCALTCGTSRTTRRRASAASSTDLHDSHFSTEMDQGTVIQVRIGVDKKKREATVDFTGTSPQQPNNFNAPEPVTRAAVLYVFRVMVDDDIPMNAGACARSA